MIADDDARDAGDEPLILAQTGVPVWVGADRAAAAQALLAAHPDVDVIVADDGLQHYALARDVEIAVVDDARAASATACCCRPDRCASPRRALHAVDAVVRRARLASAPRIASATGADVRDDARAAVRGATCARSGARIDARRVARRSGGRHRRHRAIRERFFAMLRAQGFAGRTHAFPDHHAYSRDGRRVPGRDARS